MRGISTRGKCLVGVMGNSNNIKTDDLIIKVNNAIITIPGEILNKQGNIPNTVARRLHDLSIGNITELNKKFNIEVSAI